MMDVSKNLENLSKELDISLDLIKFYLYGEDEATAQDLTKLLAHPNINTILRDIQDNRLYPDLVEDLLEDKFAYGWLDDLDYYLPFNQGKNRLIKLIRSPKKRTFASDVIRQKLESDLSPYMPDLIEQGVGCLLTGSVLYGDAKNGSDADILFYSGSKSKLSERLVQRIRKDLSKKNTDVPWYFVLDDVERAMNRMVSQKTRSLDEYKVFGGDYERTIFDMPYEVLLILPDNEMYNASEDLTNKVNILMSKTDLAVKRDPILKSILTFRIGTNIQIRESKL